MIDLKRRKARSYSDNGDAPDRSPNAGHPERSHGTWVAVAIGGSAVVGAGASMYNGNQARQAGGSAPPPRNLQNELAGISGALPGFNQAGLNTQLYGSGAISQNNLANYSNLLRGNFNSTAFEQANPGFMSEFQGYQANGELQGWTPAQYAASRMGVGENDPSLNSYYQGGLGSQMRNAYDQANPALTAYNQQFGNTVNQLNGQGPASYNASGYNASGYQATGSGNQNAQSAALAQFSPQMAAQQRAQAFSAQQQRAGGGPLLGSLERDAARGLGQVSGLQAQQQGIAQNLLSAGGGLTQGELQGAQDSARAAYSDRGLVRSNAGIGAEILQTDAAQRNRLLSNLGIAQGVDAAGQSQLATNRNYALGVQNQGQGLGIFNAGQGNNLNQFNAQNLTGLSTFNASQGNALGQFNAGQYNSVGLNLANNNADRTNQNQQFYSNLGQQNNQFNASQVNDAARFNSGASNAAGVYNSNASNEANRFNAGMAQQNQNDIFNRSAGYGNFLLGQAQNPNAIAGSLMGQAPDYTSALLGYGSDLYNTNLNSAASRYNSGQNNSAALTGAGLNFLGQGVNAFGNYMGQTSIPGGTGYSSGNLGTYGMGAGMTCWVAREVYGKDNPKWLAFRYWMLEFAPLELRDAYIAGGEELAEFIKAHPEMKAGIRAFMDEKINQLENA
jgi:hypothetical protein